MVSHSVGWSDGQPVERMVGRVRPSDGQTFSPLVRINK